MRKMKRYVGKNLITDGKFEKDGKIFEYEISWWLNYDEYQIDEIWTASVFDKNHNELDYDENTDYYDDLIIEDAYKHVPQVEEEKETFEGRKERLAEERYEAMQIEKHFA